MAHGRAPSLTHDLYRWFTDDDGEPRACDGIPADACREAPRSFVFNVANGTATKLAEQLASPGLVLAWLLQSLGAPVGLVGWLEPIRQGGALLPQLAVAARIRAVAVRKWFWVGAGTLQAVTLLIVAAVAATLSGALAGWVILATLAVFSVASGVGSVAFSDVVGKTIPRGKRGQLLALRATFGGVLTLAAGLALRRGAAGTGTVSTFLVLLASAAALWLAGAAAFAFIPEPPGQSGGGRNSLQEATRGLTLISSQPGFRRFLAARALLLPGELSVPFFALHARRVADGEGALGTMIVALGLAALVSNPVWGRLADRLSSRLVIVAAGAVIGLASIAALAIGASGPVSPLAYAPVLLLVGVAQAGMRLGRKTYLVDAAPADDRPLYVAVANTVAGALTFAWGGLGLLAQWTGVPVVLAVLAGAAATASLVAARMPEADAMVPSADRA